MKVSSIYVVLWCISRGGQVFTHFYESAVILEMSVRAEKNSYVLPNLHIILLLCAVTACCVLASWINFFVLHPNLLCPITLKRECFLKCDTFVFMYVLLVKL